MRRPSSWPMAWRGRRSRTAVLNDDGTLRAVAPEPTWLDRWGRFLGATWVVIAMIYGYFTGTLWPN